MDSRPEFLLAKYACVDIIGQGADGRVYKCIRNGTVTAVKVLNMLDPVSRARFRQEVEILKSIDHENVVKLLDADETDGTHWYESEYANESHFGTMFGYLIHSDLDRVRYFGQICLGVLALHEAQPQIIHRDLKPRNILVFQYSEPERHSMLKIADFGMSAIAGESAQLTTTGTVLGTGVYMAPERRQNPKIKTIESDIYSLGITFLEACTGDTTPNSENIDSVSDILRPVIAKMLRHHPADRYHSVKDILKDLSAPSLSMLISGRELQPGDPGGPVFHTNLAGELQHIQNALHSSTTETIADRVNLFERTLDRLGPDVHDNKAQAISSLPLNAVQMIDGVKPDVLLRLVERFDHAAENTKEDDFFFNGSDTWAWFLIQTYNLSSYRQTKQCCLGSLVKVMVRFDQDIIRARVYHFILSVEDPTDMHHLALSLREQGREDIASLLDGVPDERTLDANALRLILSRANHDNSDVK
jgi:serine/threonine protein kinase